MSLDFFPLHPLFAAVVSFASAPPAEGSERVCRRCRGDNQHRALAINLKAYALALANGCVEGLPALRRHQDGRRLLAGALEKAPSGLPLREPSETARVRGR